MAIIRWRGDAPEVAQVRAAAITAYDTTTTYKVTINGKTVSVLGQGGDATTTAAALVEALNDSTIPEFAEVTWSNSTNTVIGTADTAGMPFTCTSSVSGGGGTMGAFADTTASSGPNDFSLAQNYTGGMLPANGDTLIFEDSEVDALYNAASLSAVTLAELIFQATYTGKVGLPEFNPDGYQEYRSTYFKIGATSVRVGYGPGNGTSRIKLDTQAVQTTINVNNLSAGSEVDTEAMLWKGTHASNVVEINKGSFGAAIYANEVATIATLRVGYLTSPANDAQVRIGSGVTQTTIEQSGGNLEINNGCTTITKTNGTLVVNGDNVNVTTLNDSGGDPYSTIWNATGTLTTLNGAVGGINYSQDMRGKTVTNFKRHKEYGLLDPFKVVTFTNGIVFQPGSKLDSTLDIGDNFTLMRS